MPIIKTKSIAQDYWYYRPIYQWHRADYPIYSGPIHFSSAPSVSYVYNYYLISISPALGLSGFRRSLIEWNYLDIYFVPVPVQKRVGPLRSFCSILYLSVRYVRFSFLCFENKKKRFWECEKCAPFSDPLNTAFVLLQQSRNRNPGVASSFFMLLRRTQPKNSFIVAEKSNLHFTDPH